MTRPTMTARTGSTVANLTESVRWLAGASLARNTARAYTRALAWIDACLASQPLTDSNLAACLADRHDAGASPATIRRAVAAVHFAAKLNG